MSKFDPTLLPYFNPNIDHRVCLITGGNSGLGYYTVLHLYLHGYTVYLAGRNKSRVVNAIESIKKEAIIRRSEYTYAQLEKRHLGRLHFIEVDLLSLESVEKAARDFKTLEKALHLLILNAGIMAVPYSKTGDDFEVQLQTSYVAHFLLSDRLIELMTSEESDQQIEAAKNTSEMNEIVIHNKMGSVVKDPRIVLLSSIGHWYGMAKCAGIQFIKTMAHRHPSVLSMAVHPGTIYWILFQIFDWCFGVSNEEGSYSSVKCALSDSLDITKDNGKYFSTFGVETKPSYVAANEKYGEESWAWTVRKLESRGHSIDSL